MSAPCAGAGCPSVASVWISDWTWDDSQLAGAPPPGGTVVPPELDPCRDLVDGPLDGLVPAVEVIDPGTGANTLAPFVPPFRLD